MTPYFLGDFFIYKAFLEKIRIVFFKHTLDLIISAEYSIIKPKLYDTGVYLLNGQKIVPEVQADLPVSKEEAAKNTIAYSILKAHNTSGNMEKLQIKFDKLTSHDITFVGIIQTARASGLEKFPVPYVLTNCHN